MIRPVVESVQKEHHHVLSLPLSDPVAFTFLLADTARESEISNMRPIVSVNMSFSIYAEAHACASTSLSLMTKMN